MQIEQLTHDEVGTYAKEFRQYGMVPVNKHTTYYGIRDETGTLLCMHGLCLAGKKLVIRGSYTLPAYRGQGLFGVLFRWGMEEGKRKGATYLEATVTTWALPIYVKYGATVIRQYKKDTKVRITL